MFRYCDHFAQGEIDDWLVNTLGRPSVFTNQSSRRRNYGVRMTKNMVIVGAGPGLGQAIAERFARAGYAIGLIARDEPVLTELDSQLSASGAKVVTARADVTDPGQLQGALESCATALGTPDVVVSNTSMFVEATPTNVDPAIFELTWRVACLGSLIALQQVIPGMRKQGSGVFLMPGTPLALKPWPPGAALGAAKAAARSLVMNAGVELAPENIHAAVITIDGVIKAGTDFDPELIAERFFEVAGLPAQEWKPEHNYPRTDSN